MDKYIKQSITSRKEAIFNTYEVSADSKKKIDALFNNIDALGAKCKDVSEFEAKFAQSPLNQEYLDLFTEIATNTPVKSSVSASLKNSATQTPNIGKMVASGAAVGAAENIVNEVKNTVLPTNAAIHQKVHDETQKIPVLGDALDIGQKASYAAHLGKLFGKRKKK